METQTLYEILGYLASGFVALSLTMSRIFYLRIINLIGAITFCIYGLLIEAYPVVVVNAVIAVINLYYLRQMFTSTEYFRLIEVNPTGLYLKEFLKFYGDDIQQIIPDFVHQPKEGQIVLLVLRDMIGAGLLIGNQENDQFFIKLDYVIPGYRDFKSGQFIFRDSRDFFADRGIKLLKTTARRQLHSRYLERVGFQLTADNVSNENQPFYELRL